MTRLAVAAIIAFALALAVVSFAAAQAGQDVQVSLLDCTGDPELVVVTNQGSTAQSLTGWELRSDPEASESFDLGGALGSLLAGGSISIQSGPAASGAFTTWTKNEVFRDNDPTDYVKLVDDSGATVQQVDCPGAAVQPTPTPTATPEPSPAGEVPNGGGPPPPSADMLSPGMMILIGGSLAAAGTAAIVLPRLRFRSSLAVASPSSRTRPARRGRGGQAGKHGYSTVSLAAVALTAVMLFRFLRRRPD